MYFLSLSCHPCHFTVTYYASVVIFRILQMSRNYSLRDVA